MLGSPSRPRPVLLIVLDDPERAALLKMTLGGRGWDVVCALTCEEARAHALHVHVDALLTDLVLADGSAFGLLRSMRQRPGVSVVLTWGNQHGIRERILVSGFDLHLARPITADEIDRVLRNHLRSTA
jgi:DNA-binding response OmpR family regulator